MKKILTIILDGFGMREDIYGNAIKNAGMKNFINIWNNYPHSLLKSSQEAVNLPKNQCGSSQLGHKLIASGRKIENRLMIALEGLKEEKIKTNKNYNHFIHKLEDTNASLHIITLLSDGGVYSSIENLKQILKNLIRRKIKNKVYLELIADGEDSDRISIMKYITELEPMLNENVIINTICGRYYALNNTQEYNKTKLYYELLISGKGANAPTPQRVIELCYEKKLTDCYLPPIKLNTYEPIKDNDVILFNNINKDVYIQIFESLVDKKFNKFEIEEKNINVYSLFEINESINKQYFFNQTKIENTLGEYISNLNLNQARISETIKKEEITYYFDGERNIKLDECDLYFIDTPKVDRLDKKPEMNSLTVAKTAIKCMENDYDFILVNFANADSIGHTGNYQATINGLQAVDVCLGKLIEKAEENFYKVIIVGSHSKADTIISRANEIVTKNTCSPVPFIIMDKKIKLKNGELSMVAPTILKYMDISIPKEMKDTELLF